MLPINIKTTRDLMSVALHTERDTVKRYAELAQDMRSAGNLSAAALFERLVQEEKAHESLLLQWMQQEGIEVDDNADAISWQHPGIDATYDEEARSPARSTPYRALAYAVHHEENAFRFYTQVAAETDDDKVREFAEVLAREELGHAALLRAERRRAYHAERDSRTTAPEPEPGMVKNEFDLLLSTLYFDRCLLGALEKLDSAPKQITPLIASTRQQIQDTESALQGLQDKPSPSADAIKPQLEQVTQQVMQQIDATQETGEKLQYLYNCCERGFNFYDSIVAKAADEQLMLKAQDLSSTVLARISLLRQVLDSNEMKANPDSP